MGKILLNPYRNAMSIDGLVLTHDTYLNQSVKTDSDVVFQSITCGNLTASGTIYLSGVITEVETQNFIVKDSFVTLNDNSTDNVAPLNSGGIKILRGPSLPYYEIIYSESDQTARFGIAGNLQPIAAREESPNDGYLAIWNAASKSFITVNTFAGPLIFDGILNFNNSTYFGNTVVSGDLFDNFTIENSNSIILNTNLVKINDATLSFSNTVSLSLNGNFLQVTGDMGFLENKSLLWGTATISGSSNSLNLSGTNISLNGNINFTGIVNHGIAQFQVAAGNMYQLSSSGNISLTAGTNCKVYIQNLSLGTPSSGQIDFVNSINGDLSIDTAGNITLSPDSYVLINANKNLCFGNVNNSIGNTTFGDVKISSTAGIILQAATQVYLSSPLNFGSYSSLFESTGNGNLNITSISRDILITPGSARNVILPANNSLIFGITEKIHSDGANFIIESQGKINFATPVSVNVPILTFGDNLHYIYQDNSGTLNVSSSSDVNISGTTVQLSSLVKIGSTKIYQDTDNALTLSSEITYVKSIQDFFVTSTTAATEAGAGSIKTLGGLFVGSNLYVTSQIESTTLSVGNGVVTMSDSASPLKITNSSNTNGVSLALISQWDTNGSFTIGRGTNSTVGGRAMVFTVPSYQIYGVGSRPSFVFSTNTGIPFMTVSDILTSIVGDVSGQGNAVFGGSVEGLTFTNSSGSFSVTDSLVSITNSGLSVGTQFTVLNSSQNPIFTVDSTGGFTTVLPSTLDSVSMTNATISGTLNGGTANFAGNVNFSADVNLSGNRCYNVATPQYDNDVTTKLYVDSVAIGRTDKQAVKVASISPISDLSNPIYNIDGASVTLSDRVLLKDQANPVDNGIYTLDVNNVPQRAADFAIGMDVSGTSVFVITGIENGSVGFVVINANNIVGTDSIQWTPFSGPSTINVTVPMTKTGITLGLDLDNFSITTNPMGQLSVKNSFFGSGLSIDSNGFVVTDSNQSNITQLGTITSGNWEGTIISTPYGGTGLSSIPTGNILYGNGVNQLGNSNNFVYSAGNLGVGTASPGSNITVVNASGTYQGTRISIIDTDTIMSQSSGVTISNIENSASISVSNTGTLVLSQDTASANSKVAISTQGNQRLTIDSDGNVMINTAVPNSTSIFTVSGEIYTTGQFVSQYLNLFSLANFTVDNLSNIGGILLTASALRITSDVIVNGDLTTGNLTLKSTTSDSTISISDPTKNVKFRVSANPSGLYAIGKVGALVIPNSLQIGGDETDVTTGFTLENVNGNLTVNPGITGQSLTIVSNSIFSAPVSFNNLNDTFTFSVDSGVLQLVADSSSNTFQIGNMIANFGISPSGGFSYDPTNTTEFSGGLFSTKEMTGVSFGNQVSLEKELRFSQINSLEGSFGFNGNGFYYLGELLGRIIISVTGHWDITIDYDGNNYSVTRLSIYDRSKINLRIYDNGLGSYFVFLIVIAGPISVKVIQSPTKLFYNKFEGSSSAPSGTYSGFTGSWVLDFDLISNVSIGSIDLGQLTVSNSAAVNNLSMTGNTNVTGPITVDGESYFSGNHFTWFGTLTNSFLSALNSSELENSLTVYGKDVAAATIYLEKASAAGYVSVLSSGDPVYPNALIISQSAQDPTSQIVFKTRDAAQMTINSLGNVNILTTLNVAGLVSFEHDLQVSGNLQTSGLQINSSPIFTYSGNQLSLGNSVISNVADPVNNTDVVNLQTLHSFVQGLKTKESVVAASTASIDLSNPVTILDGVLLSVDDRILVKDQSDKTENGIYVIQVLAPVRSSDFFVGEEVTGSYVFVSSGVINEASGWVVSNSSGSGELQVGVNDITFTQFSGAGEISAGNGIVKTGNSLSVKLDTGSLEFSGNGSIRISNTIAGDGLSGGSGNPLSVTDISHLSVLGTISQGTWQGNQIAMEYGGTGLTSITAGSVPFSNGSSLAEGLLYFDQFNVRLGINTLFPISGLTVNDRDMNIVQSLSPVTNLLFTDTVNNYMYSVRNDTTSLVFSGGTGNNKTALTDLAQFDSTGTFTCNFGLNSSFVKLQDALFFTEDSVVKTVNGPLTIDYFSNDNSGTYLRFFGGMGNYNSSVDSELMTIGYFAGDYVIDVSKSGNGNFNPLILQTGSTSLSLTLETVILSKDTVILGTTDSSSQNTGALTVLGGIGVLGSIFGSNATLTGTLDCNTFNANTFTLGSIYSLGNANGILEVTGMITGNPALVHFYNFNAANTLDTLYRIFGFGKDVTSNSEWLQMGFESSNINYAIRVSSIGAGTLRPLILGFSNGNDQLILSPDGSTSVSGSLNTNSLSVFSTSDATSSHNSGAASIQGGLSVAKSLYVGTLINSNLIQSTGVLQYSNGSSIDKVYVSYSNSGNLNFYNNFNLNHNIHVANSQGPNSVNQERLTLGYRDLNTISINSTASGSGLTRDLAIETRFFPNQILLSATTGVTSFNYPVKINDTTENSFVTLGSASVSGNLIINGSGSFGSTTFNGNILTMYGYDNTWQFSTINSISNTTFLSPVATDAILQITTADHLTNLLTIDTVNHVVSSSSSLIVSNTNLKAFNIQNSSKIDSFVFDTQNHLLDVLGGRIVNLALPQSPSDAVNKVYVDNLLSGLNTKQSVNLATTSNLNILNSIDGNNVDSITVTVGMRLLLKNQINAVENGIYNVSTSGFLTRASDMANGTHAASAYTFIQQGTINADTGYVCITVSPGDVVGTNSINFTQFNGSGSLNFGDGIIYNNGTYSVALDSNSGLSFNGGKLTIDASLAGTGLSYNLGVLSITQSSGPITSGTWNADTITVPYGGTGNTAFSEGSIVYSDGTILQGTSGINWDATSSVLGINFSNTDASNGLSIQDKDINLITNLENSSSVLFSRNSNYIWRIRNDSGQSTKSTLPVSTSIQVKMSNDGTLGIILTDAGTPDYMTVNSGKTWVPTTLDGTLHAFTQIAMSHDGQYILMSARQDYLYLSQNYGATWQQKVTDFTRLWEWVSVSNSGQFQIASSLDDGLFTSQDSGSTWNLIGNLPTEVTDIGFVFCTGGAAMIFAGYTPGNLYYSTDNGVTFSQHTIRSGSWYDMVQSSGSNYLALYEYPGSLWVSNDLGNTFTETGVMNKELVSVSISGDGSVFIAAARNDLIYLSTDFGANFTATLDTNPRIWTFVRVSSDSTMLFAGGDNIPVYMSSNEGVTWTTISGNIVVNSADLGADVLFYPEYQGLVHSYSSKINTNLVISTGNSPNKVSLQDTIVLTDAGFTGFGFTNPESGLISATVDIKGSFHVVEDVEFDIALDVVSGGTGCKTLTGLVIGNGISSLTGSGKVLSGCVPVGSTDNSGEILLQSGNELRSTLGLGIGIDVQAYSETLTNFSNLIPTNGYFVVSNGSNFVTASPGTVESTLGLGNLAFSDTIDNGNFSGTSLSVSNGGTGNNTFTSNVFPFFDGTKLTNSIIYNDSINACVAIGTTSGMSNVKLLVQGDDICLKGNGSTPVSFLFANNDGNIAWRIRKEEDGIVTGNTNFVISGGIPNANSGNLIDQLSISSSGIVTISNTTETISPSTGSLVISGGLGVLRGISSAGLINFTNTSDTSVSLAGGIRILGPLNLLNTTDATNVSNGAVSIAGGLSLVKNFFTAGSIILSKSTINTSKASGITVASDVNPYTPGLPIDDSDRHMTLVNGSANGSVVFTMKNTTAAYGFDLIVDNDKFIYQTNQGSVNQIMSLNAADSVVTVLGTGDSSLVVSGGISVLKSITTVGNVNSGPIVSVTNEIGPSKYILNNDLGSASLILNNSTDNTDGDFNELTLRNGVGDLRVQNSANLGITISGINGVVTVDSTVDSTSTNNGCLIVNGGLAVKKSVNIGADFTVEGTFTANNLTSSPTISTPAGDTSNVTSLSVFSTNLITINTTNTLSANFQVTPTSNATATFFTFSLPNKISNLSSRLDVSAFVSAYYDTVNLLPVSAIATGVNGSLKVIVKFTSGSTTAHFLQVQVNYSSQ